MAGAGCRLARHIPVGPGGLLGSVSAAVRFPDRPLPTSSGERRIPRLLKASRQSREYIYPVFSAVFLPGHTQHVSLCSPGAPTPHGSAQRLSCAVIHQSIELVWTTLQFVKEPPPKRAQPLLLALSEPLLTVALPKGVLRFW